MKRNFRYITKFEEETRSARLETREETNWELNTAIDKAKEIVSQAGKLTKLLNADTKAYASLVDAMSHIKVSIARKKSEATSAQKGENITVWVRELDNAISEFYFDDDLKTYPNTPTEITTVVARLKQLIREDCSEFYTLASKIKDDLRSSTTKLDTRMASKPQPRSDKASRLEKRGFFGGDDEDEEKQPMSPDDARKEVRLFIMNTHGIYSTWMAMADDATKQWLRTHDDEDEAPTFRDVVDDFTEIVRLGINEMNKSIHEDSEDSEFPENNFSMADIKWIFEHSGAQDDLNEKWDGRKK